jgi:hypothetical protein
MSGWSLESIFSFAAPLCILFIFIGFEYSVIRRQRQAFKSLAGQFDGSCPKFFLSCSLKGAFRGLPLTITYVPQRKSAPARLRFYLKNESRFKLRIYQETAITQLSEKLGIVHEVKTGDESFDSGFMILSNDPGQAVIFLGSQDRKNTVRELFNRGFDSLVINGKRILAQKPYLYKDDSLEDLSSQKTKEVLELLSKFSSGPGI